MFFYSLLLLFLYFSCRPYIFACYISGTEEYVQLISYYINVRYIILFVKILLIILTNQSETVLPI